MTSFFKRFGATSADNSFPVIPIVPGGKFPGQFTGDRWTGLTGWRRYSTAPANDFQLSIWEDWPEAGVGIVCGRIVGIDIDIRRGLSGSKLRGGGTFVRCNELFC